MNRKLTAALLFLFVMGPTLFLFASYVAEKHNRQSLPQYTIPIMGFDPRDMIRGHYLQFTYDWPLKQNVKHERCDYNQTFRCVLCVEKSASDPSLTESTVKDIRADNSMCVAVIKGIIYNPQENQTWSNIPRVWNAKPARFYVPEEDGPLLDRVFASGQHKFAIRASLSPNGAVFPNDLLIDGKPYRDVLATMPPQTTQSSIR